MLAIMSYYTDTHMNTYDKQIYLGNKKEKLVSHAGEVVITDPNTCAYCSMTFNTRNQLFLHLGYCDVDIRNRKRKRKRYQQLKITKFMSCADYDADTEAENFEVELEIDEVTSLFKNLATKNNERHQPMKKIKKKNKPDIDVLFKKLEIGV